MKYLFATVLCGALLGCAPTDMPEPDEGRTLFDTNCTLCHGVGGRGDGPFAAGLDPAPADLTGISARNDGVFPVSRVLSTIDGYARSPQSDQNMPEFGLLLHGGSVPVDTGDGLMTPTPRPLAALLVYLQSIQDG